MRITRNHTVVVLGVVAIVLFGTTGMASAHKYHSKSSKSASNHLVLDSYEPNNDGFAGAVQSKVLPKHTNWIAEVQGTFNYYDTRLFVTPSRRWPIVCGTPDMTGPMFPSEVHPTYQGVGMDPEFIFARPWTQRKCDRNPMPLHWTNFQISRGVGFANRTALGTALLSNGRPTAVAPDHKYLYPIAGIGQPAKFRLKDRPRTSDNYGTLHITVRRAQPSDCAVGYSDFGFSDVATCEAEIAS